MTSEAQAYEPSHDGPGGENQAVRERLLPEMPMLWRGAAFAGVALVALRMARLVGRGPAIVRLPGALMLGGVAILSIWAAAIHLTGGEKFDDHDCI